MPQQASPASPPAPKAQQGLMTVPLGLVGGNRFGRYPKQSREETINMMVSDDFLVDYAGYKMILQLSDSQNATGRGIYASIINDEMIAVVSSGVYSISHLLIATFVGNLQTSTGEVYITENNAGQIALSDGVNIYIYNPNASPTFQIATIDFVPGFLAFQDTRFICAAIGTATWRLSGFNDGLSWPDDAQHVGAFETKPDTTQAAVPMPGRGNMLFVFGNTVSEQWNDVGNALFPYQKNNSFNIDYGCINPSSIAYQGNFIVWIGVNEEAGPVVMFTSGGDIDEVSTDGIDFKLGQLKNPEDCSGFLIKVDGHLFYQFTFPSDNISYLYDFGTKMFFTVTDENLNYHIARKIVFFNNTYYFVSFKDGNLYAFGTQYTTYQYSSTYIKDIPRIRFCPPIRITSQRPFIVKSLGFTIEQGQDNASGDMAVDLCISNDGAETFSSSYRLEMNPPGLRKSRFIYQRLGRSNDFTAQLQFWGDGRYAVGEGEVELFA